MYYSELSISEKENHSESLEKRVAFVNRNLNPYRREIDLVQISYGIPINSHYFYYDCPYNPVLDEINYFLGEKRYDSYIFDAFSQMEERGKQGFIYFESYYSKEKNKFHIIDHDNNFSAEIKENINFKEVYYRYICLINNCINFDANYKADIVLDSDFSGRDTESYLLICDSNRSVLTQSETFNYTWFGPLLFRL